VETCRGIGGCAHIRTFAYVVSTCTAHAFHQKLQIRHGNCDPITLLDFPEPVETPPPLCATIGIDRGNGYSPIFGAFQRLGVSPDGRHVVFEVTDDFTAFRNFTVLRTPLVPPGQPKGIFVVRADGRGLRRLGPASRDPAFRFAFDPAAPNSSRASLSTILSFSPDGREVVLTDLGPGPGGEEAVQLFTLDLVTGSRTQVTHLPVVADRPVAPLILVPAIYAPIFLADGRIAFESFGNLDGSNPEGNWLEFVVNRDGSDLQGVPLPVALPGTRAVPIFGIEGGGARRRADVLSLPGAPVNPGVALLGTIVEIFFIDGKNFLQLTDFRRVDTESPTLTPDGHLVLFRASADPFGTNRSGTCQLFSINTRATGLRQLTHFSQPEYSVAGCYAFAPPGCVIFPYGGADPATGTVMFYATCDPFGTNPYGDQLFAIRVDGTQLRQLTHTRGLGTEPDGTVSTENIGPFAYSAIVSGQH
jgi:hypothetical protein